MTDSNAIHLLWQLLPASDETMVTMNGLKCFATHAWTDQFTLCCLIPPRRLYRFIPRFFENKKTKKGHFLTENTLYFSKDLPIWSFYVNIVLHNGNSGSYLSRLGYSCACSSNDITERAEHEWCVIISWIMMLFIPALRACVCDVSFGFFFYYLDVASRRTEACWIQDLKSVLVPLQMPHMS